MGQYDPPRHFGIPNPLGPRTHNWKGGPLNEGSLFHGPLYTRPMYNLPWVARPLNGLGQDVNDMQIKTRNGLFANEGHGGGVFNYNTAFGGLSGADTAHSIQGLPAMGALSANKVLPGKCWDKPGFKDCHALAYSEAQKKCGYCAEHQDDPMCFGYTTMADCQERETNAMAWDNCVSSFCPSESPVMQNVDLGFQEYKVGDPCSSANTIKNVQFVSGAKSDGIWGNLSQRAYENLVRIQGTTYCELVPGCTGNTPLGAPCGGGAVTVPTTTAPPPVPVPEPEPELEPELEGSQHASMGGLMVAGLAALLAVGTVAYLAQGKKKRR